MKILFSITAYPPSIGGAQLHHHQMARELSSQNDVQVICHWDQNRTDWLLGTTIFSPKDPKDYIYEGVPVHRLNLSPAEKMQISPGVLFYYLWMEKTIPLISGVLQKKLQPWGEKADIIHNVRIGREGLSYASLKLARDKGIPFVFTPVHHPRWVGWPYEEYLKLYRESDAVIALTNIEKRKLIELGVQENRIFVSGMGPILAKEADGLKFRRDHNIEGPMILFLGQLHPYKGYSQLLEASRMVWKKVPEANFIFIGPPVKNNQKIFENYIDDQRIHYLGLVSLQEKTNALAACDILCVPSVQESFGGVYTEAWSFERPVIGCNIPAVSEVISDGIDGFLVEQNVQDIAEKLNLLLENSSLREEMGKSGKKKVQSRFTWPVLAEKTMQIYQGFL